ncbi:MAG TPA: enoyl-ACP reductase [Thermoleophilia bacterium]|nr:enoyl-ACP reductase [Thermoleophilia bacterium]
MPGVLEGRRGLIMGLANERSIAWGIAQAARREGAELAFTYAGEMLEKRVRPLAAQLGSDVVLSCDVRSDEEIERCFEALGERWGSLDFLVHAIAYANKEELTGEFYNTTREGFRVALDVSVYSLVATTRSAVPLMREGGSIVTLTYLGAERTIPHYNVMGVAKAGLEAAVRYLAADLGPSGIRVNAISAGPIRTLAASGIGDFRKIFDWYDRNSPLHRNTTIEEVGNAAVPLLSDWSRQITGEVLHVDGGYHITGVPPVVEEE